VEQIGDLLHVDGIIERRRVTDLTLVGCHFALQTLGAIAVIVITKENNTSYKYNVALTFITTLKVK